MEEGSHSSNEERSHGSPSFNRSNEDSGGRTTRNESDDDDEGELIFYYGEEEPPLPSSKRLKNITLDRISALPDSLLLHVLSFLPMKEVVKTATLSKRWQYVWTCVSMLLFHNASDDYEDVSKFVASVNKTLMMWRGGNIKRFVIDSLYEECFASDVDLWIRLAVRYNVEALDLYLHSYFEPSSGVDKYRLPGHLYTNSSLTSMSLVNCDVVPSGNINWSSLKSLSIQYLEVSENVIEKIVSGCPVLEFLKLSNLDFIGCNHLDINSATLKILVIESCGSAQSLMEISAPNLQSLHILGEITGIELRLIDVSSLLNAKIAFFSRSYDYERQPNHIRQLLESLQHVEEFELGANWIQAWSKLEMPLSNCKCLRLDIHIDKSDISGIAGLLQSTPNLETLILKLTSSSHYSRTFALKFVDYWASQKGNFECLSTHLKMVKIIDFWGDCEIFILPLVQFLLGNARVLEKMVFNTGRLHHRRSSMCCVYQNFYKLSQKFLSFPRSSPDAVIMFSEMAETSNSHQDCNGLFK